MVRRSPILWSLLFAACSTGGTPHGAAPAAPDHRSTPWVAPPTRISDTVDEYHGTLVADPYRWLEDQGSAEVAAWIRSQNDAARAVLDAVPQRPAIRARLQELWNFERYGAPERAGDHWFYTHNDGLQNQAVLYVTADPAQRGRVLLDPNALSRDGTVALSGLSVDERGQRIAYATSSRGSDWRTWRVRDVATGEDLPDTIEWSKFAGAAWTHDGKGFFYQRFPAPSTGATFSAPNRNPQLCYHVLGTAAAQDRIVYERPDQPDWRFQPVVTDDGRWLVIQLVAGSDRRNRIAYADLTEDGWPVRALLMDFDAGYDFVGNDEDRFFFRTDQGAPRGRLVAVPRANPDRNTWVELVPQRDSVLRAVQLVGGRFVCSYLEDAASRVLLFDTGGTAQGEILLPSMGTAAGFTGRPRDRETFFTFTTFTAPPAVFRYDFATGKCAPFRQPALPFDAGRYVTTRAFLQSRDGTRLCLFLVHHQGLRLDGSSRCYLFGYGGFDIPMTPRFSVQNLVLLERGGIYAQAVLRGGGEYGESWHRAGMLERKQNVFDDFIACAEYLIRNGYTSRPRLCIGGGSNGGLLVGAVLTQRPDLIGAAIPEVGVLDMLRYHRFTIGWAWAAEYGRSDDPEQFPWLLRYSPLHNVRPGTSYPPTLVMTGDHDDRVLPAHSFKFAAALQAAQGGPAPILLRVEIDTGHGAGKPVAKLIEEAADRLAFLELALGS